MFLNLDHAEEVEGWLSASEAGYGLVHVDGSGGEYDGQGKSCSMCYGDIEHGKDGYYRDWAEEQEREQEQDPPE